MVLMPKAVKVGPYTYRIAVTPDIDEFGHTANDAHRIAINVDQSAVSMKDTLLHEVLHACFFTVNLRDQVDFETEERVVRRLATILLQVLRSNPKLVDYLGD